MELLFFSACVIGYEERGVKNCEWQNPKRELTIPLAISPRAVRSTQEGLRGFPQSPQGGG